MRLIVPKNRAETHETGVVDMDLVRASATKAYKRKIYWLIIGKWGRGCVPGKHTLCRYLQRKEPGEAFGLRWHPAFQFSFSFLQHIENKLVVARCLQTNPKWWNAP